MKSDLNGCEEGRVEQYFAVNLTLNNLRLAVQRPIETKLEKKLVPAKREGTFGRQKKASGGCLGHTQKKRMAGVGKSADTRIGRAHGVSPPRGRDTYY